MEDRQKVVKNFCADSELAHFWLFFTRIPADPRFLNLISEVPMAKRSFDDETLKWVREMPLSLVLDRLRDAGKLFWRRDADFKPEKDARTVRLFVSSPEGFAWELLVTGPKWFDTRAGKGGGGGIDLVMHLLGLDFVKSVKLLASVGAPGQRQPERQG